MNSNTSVFLHLNQLEIECLGIDFSQKYFSLAVVKEINIKGFYIFNDN